MPHSMVSKLNGVCVPRVFVPGVWVPFVFVLLMVAAAPPASVYAQTESESPTETENDSAFEELFADPSIGLIEDEPGDEETGEFIDIAEATTAPEPIFSGSVRTRGGVNFGVKELHDTPGELRDVMGGSGLFDMQALLRVDYRPTAFQRFFASFITEMDEESLAFSTPEVDELFVDYTLRERYFFRAGKQSLTWGLARLLDNPGNFVTNLKGGIGLRTTAPLGPVSATGIIYNRASYRPQNIDEVENPNGPRAFAYAGRLIFSHGRHTLGASAHYRYLREPPLRTSAHYTTVLGPVDLGLEGVTAWNTAAYRKSHATADLDPEYQFLANALWESRFTPRLRIITEYRFDGSVAHNEGHRAGLGVRLSELGWTGWRPTLRWLHAFHDNSGQVLAGVEGSMAPRITAQVGVPFFYGDPDTAYFKDDEELPDEFVVSGVVLLSMTISF